METDLLDDLYVKTFQHLSSGVSVHERQRQIVRRRQNELSGLLRRHWGSGGIDIVQRLPRDLLATFSEDDLFHHVGVALEYEVKGKDRKVRIAARNSSMDTVDLTICCEDASGLLSQLTGSFVAHGIDVISGKIHTLSATRGQSATVLDVFTVTGISASDHSALQRLEDTLREVLSGATAIETVVAPYLNEKSFLPRAAPAVATEIVIDNEGSDRFTIVEIRAVNKRGLLYTITGTLAAIGLDIFVAKTVTEAHRGIMSFYVSDHGKKIATEEAIQSVRERIGQRLSDFVR